MGYLVSENQCSFISGRQGLDNIIIAQEAIHSMRTKKGQKGFVAVKVDMEKAYDRFDWKFLECTLGSLGLAEGFIGLIMKFVNSVSMRILWNGQESKEFQPTRGVRQGDPLSPYLFILCMERLSQIIQYEVENGR